MIFHRVNLTQNPLFLKSIPFIDIPSVPDHNANAVLDIRIREGLTHIDPLLALLVLALNAVQITSVGSVEVEVLELICSAPPLCRSHTCMG